MNSVEMVRHSQFHQREQPPRAVCPVGLESIAWQEPYGWSCAAHPTVTAPAWVGRDALTCPYPALHG